MVNRIWKETQLVSKEAHGSTCAASSACCQGGGSPEAGGRGGEGPGALPHRPLPPRAGTLTKAEQSAWSTIQMLMTLEHVSWPLSGLGLSLGHLAPCLAPPLSSTLTKGISTIRVPHARPTAVMLPACPPRAVASRPHPQTGLEPQPEARGPPQRSSAPAPPTSLADFLETQTVRI